MKRSGTALLTAALTLLAACQPRPETAYDASQPRTAAVRNIGNFNEALRCMDDMFVANGKQDIFITTAGIPDATGLIATGTKEMFITALSRMSTKSGAFRYVDYDVTQTDVQILSENIPLSKDFRAPNFYVRGAITQLDSNVLQSAASAGVSIPNVDLAVNANQIVSVMSIDLNVGDMLTRQMLPGMTASNSIAVVQSGKGADLGGLIGKAGVSFSVSLDKSEGFHQAVRNLIELSSIEILGKLTHVPYWQCLSIDSTNPNFRADARGWFDAMTQTAQARYVSDGLVRAGYLNRAGDGQNAALSEAVAHYQADHDLVPSGRIDFELYYRLLASDHRQDSSAPPAASAAPASPPGTPAETPPGTPPGTSAGTSPGTSAGLPPGTPPGAPAGTPPQLLLSTVRGPRPSYHVGETMEVTVQPTQDAYVYCYYQDATGTVARIFPNRFQADPFVRSGTRLTIPPAGVQSFALRFDKAGSTESVGCLGADREVGLRLPDRLKAQDLAALPVNGLDDVASQFHAIQGAHVDDARLAVEVTQ